MTMNGITFLTGSNVAVTDSTYTLGYTNEVLEKILLNKMYENFVESCWQMCKKGYNKYIIKHKKT